MFAPLLHHSTTVLANAELLPSEIDGTSVGWGGLIALSLLVVAILFSMYIAAREEWQFAQGTHSQAAPRSERGDNFGRSPTT